jgi:hypothetical protein
MGLRSMHSTGSVRFADNSSILYEAIVVYVCLNIVRSMTLEYVDRIGKPFSFRKSQSGNTVVTIPLLPGDVHIDALALQQQLDCTELTCKGGTLERRATFVVQEIDVDDS